MYNDQLLSRLADTYQAEKVAGAERARLLKQVRSGRPVLRHRILAWSGNRLIVFGRALKDRYEMGPHPVVVELTADNR